MLSMCLSQQKLLRLRNLSIFLRDADSASDSLISVTGASIDSGECRFLKGLRFSGFVLEGVRSVEDMSCIFVA